MTCIHVTQATYPHPCQIILLPYIHRSAGERSLDCIRRFMQGIIENCEKTVDSIRRFLSRIQSSLWRVAYRCPGIICKRAISRSCQHLASFFAHCQSLPSLHYLSLSDKITALGWAFLSMSGYLSCACLVSHSCNPTPLPFPAAAIPSWHPIYCSPREYSSPWPSSYSSFHLCRLSGPLFLHSCFHWAWSLPEDYF